MYTTSPRAKTPDHSKHNTTHWAAQHMQVYTRHAANSGTAANTDEKTKRKKLTLSLPATAVGLCWQQQSWRGEGDLKIKTREAKYAHVGNSGNKLKCALVTRVVLSGGNSGYVHKESQDRNPGSIKT